MKNKNYFPLIILMLVGILLTLIPGCSGDSDFVDISVQDFDDRVRESLPNLHSYEMAIQVIMNAEGEAEDESATVKYVLQGEGAVDLAAKKTGMEMSVNVKGNSGSETIDQTARVSSYVIDDISYTGTSDENGDMEWQHQTISSSAWEEGLQSEQLIHLFESSQIETLKAETVQGERCFLVELDPDPALLWDTVMSQIGGSSGGTYNEDMGNAMKKTSVKYWFVQDTLFFKRIYIYMDIELDAETMGVNSGEMHYIIEMTMDFNNHNQSMNIELPAEALES